MEDTKQQLKSIIIRSLRITDMTPEQLGDDTPLLDGPVEIDSIDMLQLILEIERNFGVKLVRGKFEREEWASINTLAAAIESRLVEAGR